MKPNVDLDSFLSFIPQSRLWEAYIQGRTAIHVEYGNIHSAESRLKLTPISRLGARITAFDRNERFSVEGNLDAKEQIWRGKSVNATLSGDFPPPEEVHTFREVVEPKIDPNGISTERLCEQILARLEWIIKRLRGECYQVKVWSGWEFRGYYNSLGSIMTSVFPLSKLKISVQMAQSKLIKRAGAREGVEFFENPPRMLVEDFLQDVQQAKIAKKKESIPRVLILDPEAMAIFIHEAIGHSIEGDHVLGGNSYLPGLCGQQIAPSSVTIVDSPMDFSSLASYPFDDEGTLAQTTPLVEKGVIRGYLMDRNASVNLKTKSTGNSRSFWYDATPKVRMSNFIMLPGVRRFESILRETKDGLLIKGMREGGSDEKTGNFHFKPNIAYEIINGELKKAILISEIEGNAIDYLKAITEVSSEWSLCVAGCGKPTPQSDYVWVGYGAPFVKFELAL
jgi:predicted Zn-dependent protease